MQNYYTNLYSSSDSVPRVQLNSRHRNATYQIIKHFLQYKEELLLIAVATAQDSDLYLHVIPIKKIIVKETKDNIFTVWVIAKLIFNCFLLQCNWQVSLI